MIVFVPSYYSKTLVHGNVIIHIICRNVYATVLTVLLFLAVFLLLLVKHISSQSANVYSALEALAAMLCIN